MTISRKRMGVIFDLDGVLVDTAEFHKKAWFDLAEEQGYEMSEGLFETTFGMRNSEILALLAGQSIEKKEIERLSAWKERRYRELVGGRLRLCRGAERLLGRLKRGGFMLAVGTSTPRENLRFMLQHIAISDIFDAYVTGEEVRKGKPAPDIFLKAARKLGVPPARCVVVEDAVQGVRAGKAAGMAVVAITTTRKRADLAEADRIVDCLTELGAADFKELLAQ